MVGRRSSTRSKASAVASVPPKEQLPKCPTGIEGLDEVTFGGLPLGRPTLVCGGPGCGKTLLAIQFLVNGAVKYGEPGVLIVFEETPEEIVKNSDSLGYHLEDLEKNGKLVIDHIVIEPRDVIETGEYDLEGLFIRIGMAIESVGAKRVVLDTIESLFSSLSNEAIIRAELRRLFRWLKDKQVTTIVTGEAGNGTLTRQGLEEYVSDCVVVLDHRIINQISTRRMRVAKYRGSAHGTNEYPFVIDDEGITLLPITSLCLVGEASSERVSTGIEDLDRMMGGKGYYRGSTVLVSGDSGTGKTSVAMEFVAAACQRGERALYIATEESPGQLTRNMRSIGIDLDQYLAQGLLRIHAIRATMAGMENHLSMIHRMMDTFDPKVMVIDPVTSFTAIGGAVDAKAMMARVIDYSKTRNITTILTDLLKEGNVASPEESVSSLMDTWITLQRLEANGENNRVLYVLKSRGMAHSNQIREFIITDDGIKLVRPYIGQGGVLTGTARFAQEAGDRSEALSASLELESLFQELERLKNDLKNEVADVKADFKAKENALNKRIAQLQAKMKQVGHNEEEMRRSRDGGRPTRAGAKVRTE